MRKTKTLFEMYEDLDIILRITRLLFEKYDWLESIRNDIRKISLILFRKMIGFEKDEIILEKEPN